MKSIFRIVLAALVCAAQSPGPASAEGQVANGPKGPSKPVARAKVKLENHRDLIDKARNLTLQRDRLQASQVLKRALLQETKGAPAYREILKALDDLTGLFYTEKGQSLFSQAESMAETRLREAVDVYLSALRAEEGNITIIKALARAHVHLQECEKAEVLVTQAEVLHPISSEIRLLRLQATECAGQFDRVAELLLLTDLDLAPVERYLRSLQIKDALRRGEAKRARTLLAAWEAAHAEYPEVQFWKWRLSADGPAPDRQAALKYALFCQNMTARKKKSYILDTELCKGREKVEEYLKASGAASEPASSEE